MNTSPLPVAPAPLQGVLTDAAIAAMISVAGRVERGQPMTETDAALVMQTFGPAARELEQWRRKGALICELIGDNVVLFPAVR